MSYLTAPVFKIGFIYGKDKDRGYAADREKRRLPSTVSYWFVWHSFHPDTDIFKGPYQVASS
ncbi:MAG: DUF3179 domain-containing (seleno)protein, partial [Deltaproteobacteria bacterium]|nr:DUF3179 domain-containing (seleno)protein [Deltaproteobacteria bacterium]